MAKYLIQASYKPEGVRGLLKDGGTGRRQQVASAVEEAGGNVEAFYYAFGATDAIVLLDLPDNATAAALSLAVNASGAVSTSVTPLLTAEDIDAACEKSVGYTPPGS